ncbi:MAG: prolipoprotein diacylglyceryl transferase [Canibacter sp.]
MILPASIPSPDLQFWQLGPIRIYLYALCIIAGIVIAAIVAANRLGKRGGEKGAVIDFAVWAVVLGIVCARFYHVVTHWGDYVGPGKDFTEIFAVWNGGIAIFGALIGGGLGVLIASRLNGVRFWSFADALVPGLLLAQAFGRLGNYFNHELFGGPTTLPWGLEIESTNAAFPIGLPEGTLMHPTFLYEIVWNVLGVIILLTIEKRFQPRWGKFFGMYLIWYGIGRFWIEGMRLDPSFILLGLRTNQLAALAAIIIGIVIIVVQTKRHTGIETTVYLPGRQHPNKNNHSKTDNPDEYHHVFAPITVEDDSEAESEDIESESPTVK